LYDQTVTSPDFCFTADSGLGKISATLNGEALHKSGSNYSCILKKGANTIILKGKYGSESFTNQFTVTYSPPLSEGDLPKITNINVFDGKTVKGSVYTLTLTANDSDGNRLNSQKIVVLLNGKVIRRQWENSDETGYRLNLENGENSLSITVTDSSGASRDYYYRISRQPTESGEEIGRVTVSVNAANAGISDICTAADYPFYDGETSYDILCRLLSENDFEVTASGGYIRRISKENAFASCTLSSTALDYLSAHSITASGDFKADSLGEFDVTSGSGWVYFKNGKQPNYALSEDYPTDGDSIILSFTLDYGNDLGGRS
jgi:hypothetical protein